MLIPDYKNISTENKIATLNQEWEVEETGFVYLHRLKIGGNYGAYNAYFIVDGVIVTDATPLITTDIIPVYKGQKVSCKSDTSVGEITCKYIPPIK